MFDKKYIKPIAIVVGVIIICTILFGGRSAKKAAKDYVEGMLEADAAKVYAVLCDESREKVGETKKIAIDQMQDALDGQTEKYENKYGNRWKYKIRVIDAYDYESSVEEYADIRMMKVVVEVTHQGSGLFNDKEGEETITVKVVKEGRKWYVVS